MDESKEISKKIKSAIEAKLSELDAYSDDVLPEYIMVMVANKKSKSMMKQDLQLFLREHTNDFTDWLHELLEKLKVIAVEKASLKQSKESATREEQGKKEEKRKKESKKQEFSRKKSVDVNERKRELQSDHPKNSRLGKGKNEVVKDKRPQGRRDAEKEIKQTETDGDHAISGAEIESQPIFKLTEADDEFEEEPLPENVVPPKRSLSISSKKKMKSSCTSQGQKRISSVVRSALKTLPDEELHTEYDPHLPMIATVASKVNVGERKPSVPLSKQANQKLLLRAMSDACNSTGSIDKGRKRAASPRSTDNNTRRRVHERLGSRGEECEHDLRNNITSSRLVQVVQKKSPTEKRRIKVEDTLSWSGDEEELRHVDIEEEQPHFVVTLDDDGDDILPGNNKISVIESPHNVVHVKPYRTNSDSPVAELSEEPKNGASNVKCRFYPKCLNKTCPFLHPVTQCSMFPNCRFKDACLFIHPTCKFDACCSKRDCPFQHSGHRKPLPQQTHIPMMIQPVSMLSPMAIAPDANPVHGKLPPHMVTCKFFPKCTNMNCKFNHPEPCRFGISCAKKNTCKFLHPDLPNRQLLTWKSS